MKILLLFLTCFIAITAIIGGSMLLATPDGSSLQLSPTLLHGTPFKNFVIPGLILLLVVGGSNLIAGIELIRHHKKYISFTQVAGALICGWIIGQMTLTGVIFWLQFVYLLSGITIIYISFQLKDDSYGYDQEF